MNVPEGYWLWHYYKRLVQRTTSPPASWRAGPHQNLVTVLPVYSLRKTYIELYSRLSLMCRISSFLTNLFLHVCFYVFHRAETSRPIDTRRYPRAINSCEYGLQVPGDSLLACFPLLSPYKKRHRNGARVLDFIEKSSIAVLTSTVLPRWANQSNSWAWVHK